MLSDTLQSDLKQAQLQRDETKVSTLRMLLSELKYAAIASKDYSNDREGLPDEEVTKVIQKEIKKRKEGAAGFRQGGREELALKEEAESQILQSYLPEQLSDEELTKMVDQAIKEIGATSISDMGKVISSVLGKASGKADGSRVSGLVKSRLSASSTK